MADAKVVAEEKRLRDLAHGAYETLQRAVNQADPTVVESLRDAWQAKHKEWWKFVHTKVLGKPSIIVDSINMVGPNPLDDL